MKVATFNINNVVRRQGVLLEWLAQARPDIVCLQELKAEQGAFPIAALEAAGYGAVWSGQRTWNGVAILTRDREPVLVRRGLPGDPADTHARYIEAAVEGMLIACLYLPNGNPRPGPKFAYKLAWFERLIVHARSLIEAAVPAVLAGDFNVVPTDLDIYPTRSWDDDALLAPESREAFARLLGQGWTDALRERNPNARLYTFWDYKRQRWARDAGLRLDHLLLSPAVKDRLTGAGVDKAVRGVEGASDHAPAWAELDWPAKRRKARG